MDEPVQLKKIFEEIISSQDFDRLKPFADATIWQTMTKDEKELLAQLFVMQGEKQLSAYDNQVLESFRLANQAAPDHPKILYRQALAFALQRHNIYCLRASSRIFEKIVMLEPSFFDAWHGWGNVLMLLGALFGETEGFQAAQSKFQQAVQHSDSINSQRLANFYYDWGVCLYYLGRNSGEPAEFCSSIRLFQCAAGYGLDKSDFWNDYGNSLVELSSLLNKHTLLLESVEYYWRAIRLSPDYNEGWVNLANTLLAIYQLYPHDAYFALSDESFDQALRFEPQNATLWLKWGKLYFSRGKRAKDIEKLRESRKKFEIADSYEPKHSSILTVWAEALMIEGILTEDLGLLRQAEQKIIKSVEVQPENSFAWSLYGRYLLEVGNYFQDTKFFSQAQEKIKYGLKLDPRASYLWHELGLASFALGQQREDTKWLEEASRCFAKAIDCVGGSSAPQYWNDWGVACMKLAQMTDEKNHILAAVSKFEQAIRLASSPTHQEPNEVEWLYNYGCALDFLGDYENDTNYYEKAIQVLQRVLEIEPNYLLAHYNLGVALSHLGALVSDLDCFHEAVRHFEIYLTQYDSEDDYAWCEWGLTLLDIAQLIKDPVHLDLTEKLYVEAESKFLYALALGNTQALYHLACLFSLLGNYATAIHYLEQAKTHRSLPSIDDLLNDEWLDGLRQTRSFQNFLSHI